eukprot:TRINITY_DN18081_c0_g2_i1.p1 TRINITY_DN18081_c0_g2~~TRINITY_DN18081_c0_g2_i1.p1  ORF type:complete len:411 (-),score=65.18 TRINITY_DN18081_c0_g2_i1:11-1243(-)
MKRRTPFLPLFGCVPSKISYLFLAFLTQLPPVANSIAIKTRLELGSGSNESAGNSNVTGSNNTATTGGKVFFLFLADDSLPNEEIWIRFFAPARPGLDFEALVHCRNELACRQGVGSRGLFQVIPTVPSTWCEDLVSPMNALLQAALRVDGAAAAEADSFTFISDTTVPVKPLKTVLQRMALDRRRGSSFCIAPKASWGVLDSNHSAVVKHSQWLTLSRQHARRVVASTHRMRNLMELATPNVMDEMLGQYLTTAYQSTLGKVFGRMPLNGCLDEYLYFALVYGFSDGGDNGTWPKPVLDDLHAGQLNMADSSAQDFQGQCDTFVYWGYGKQFSKLAAELRADSATHLEIPLWAHPAYFTNLSTMALRSLYKSDFLFARKIDSRFVRFVGQGAAATSLTDAFDKYIFDEE